MGCCDLAGLFAAYRYLLSSLGAAILPASFGRSCTLSPTAGNGKHGPFLATSTCVSLLVGLSAACLPGGLAVRRLAMAQGARPGSTRAVGQPGGGAEHSATGTRTRVARVRAEYPNQLDYSGFWEVPGTAVVSSPRLANGRRHTLCGTVAAVGSIPRLGITALPCWPARDALHVSVAPVR